MNEKREVAVKFRVGIFVLVALLTFLGAVYALGARARLFEARYTIHADFTEVGGLVEGATVRLAGVQIGRVSAVNLPPQPGGKVQVDLTIARRFSDRIRKNSVARIETQVLLGDRIVEITVGDPSAPAVAPGEVLASRDPADFGRIMASGAETAKNVAALADALRETADQINKSKMIESAAATVNKLGRVVDQVEQGRGWAHTLLYEEPVALKRLNELIASTQTVIDRVERRGRARRGCWSRRRAPRRRSGSWPRWIASARWWSSPSASRVSCRASCSIRSTRRSSTTSAWCRTTCA